jgi:uncharacterized membrane protein
VYPIEYSTSFVVFWGLALGAGLYCGGLLLVALVAMMIFVLISHEHAHLLECERLGAHVKKVVFTAVGGQVHFTAQTVSDTISICRAGVVDSSCYAISFIALFAMVSFVGKELSWNFADADPLGMLWRMRMLQGLVFFAVVLVVSNVLPVVYHHKIHGTITTDGWATVLLKEDEKEWWNEGRAVAVSIPL